MKDLLVLQYEPNQGAYFSSDVPQLVHNLPGTYESTCEYFEELNYPLYQRSKVIHVPFLKLDIYRYIKADFSYYINQGFRLKTIKPGTNYQDRAILTRHDLQRPCRRLLPDINVIEWMTQFPHAEIIKATDIMPELISETFVIEVTV